MPLWEGFIYGFIGGIFALFVELYPLRHRMKTLPGWTRDPFYWGMSAAALVLGGVVVVIYMRSGFVLNPFLAANVGASAPLILTSWTKNAPPFDPGRSK